MAIDDKRPPKLGKYFNTHDVTPEELELYEQQNLAQDLRILVFLKSNRGRLFDKHQIGKQVFGNAYPVPITHPLPKKLIAPSTVARAINTLMKKRLVIKSIATYWNKHSERNIHRFSLNSNPNPRQTNLF